MIYIDENGLLIYESCNMRSEIVGVESEGFFKLELIW